MLTKTQECKPKKQKHCPAKITILDAYVFVFYNLAACHTKFATLKVLRSVEGFKFEGFSSSSSFCYYGLKSNLTEMEKPQWRKIGSSCIRKTI